jgi:hypothetical protein
MIAPETEITLLRQKLDQAYQKLPTLQRQIVRLFSVIYEPVSRSNFLQCINALGAKDEQGKTLISKTLKPHLEYLLEQELLIQERGKSPRCHPLIAEIATRDAIEADVWSDMVAVVSKHLPISLYYNNKEARHFNSIEQLLREVRIGIYRQDIEFIFQQFECYQQYGYHQEPLLLDDVFNLLFNNPFDPYWFNQLPQEFYELGLASTLSDSLMNLFDAEEHLALLKTEADKPDGRCSDILRLLLAEQLILRDDREAAKHSLEQIDPKLQQPANVFWGWLAFLEGDTQKAIALYTSALESLKQGTKKRKIFFDSLGGVFFVLALLQEGSPTRLREAEDYCKIMAAKDSSWLSYIYAWLSKVLKIQQGDLTQKEWVNFAQIAGYQESNSLETFFCSLCLYWVDEAQAKRRVPRLLKSLSDQAEATGYYWLAVEAAELLFRLKTKKSLVAEVNSRTETPSLVDLIKPQQPWELSLKALANIQKPQVKLRRKNV